MVQRETKIGCSRTLAVGRKNRFPEGRRVRGWVLNPQSECSGLTYFSTFFESTIEPLFAQGGPLSYRFPKKEIG